METTRTQRMQAPPDRVFHALVEPTMLTRWFCDVARVEPREGGAYEFSGAHAYGGSSRGRILQFEPGTALRYTWALAGAETIVTATLDAVDTHRTDLHVTHANVLAAPVEVEHPGAHLGAVWTVLLHQLGGVLTGRPVPRYDFTTLPDLVVDLDIEIMAPIEQVWQKLTVPAELDRWVSQAASVDLRVGGRYSYGWAAETTGEYGPQVITALEPPHLLAFSWIAKGTLGTVTWTLDPIPGGTRVRLVHEGLGGRRGLLTNYHIGWWECLVALREA